MHASTTDKVAIQKLIYERKGFPENLAQQMAEEKVFGTPQPPPNSSAAVPDVHERLRHAERRSWAAVQRANLWQQKYERLEKDVIWLMDTFGSTVDRDMLLGILGLSSANGGSHEDSSRPSHQPEPSPNDSEGVP